MKLILQFDVEKCAVYLPDGYAIGINELQNDFFTWSDEQSETFILGSGNILCKRYTLNLFLRYLNEELLAESTEKAYQIRVPSNIDKRTFTLRF